MELVYSKPMDHLGLVAGMIDELKIVQTVDNYIDQDLKQRNLSIGECVKALILNGLGFVNYQLYLVSEFYENKSIEILFGRDIDASMFNDDVLGRALDSLYESGVSYLFTKISSVVCKELNIGDQTYHIDGTSFHLHGKYEAYGDDTNVIEVVQGYSRDFHPELNQVVLDLIASNSSGIPLAMKPLSGNSSDKKDFPKIIKEFISNLKYQEVEKLTFIGDSALYTSNTLEMFPEGMKFISRVPENIKEVKNIYKNIDKKAFVEIDDNYSYAEFESEYGGIKQRWIVIDSSAAYTKKRVTFRKNLKKKVEAETKSFESLQKRSFACETDALNEAKIFFNKCNWISGLNITTKEDITYVSKGRPTENSSTKKSYTIQAEIIMDEEKVKNEESKLGYFVLATNHLDKYSAQEILKLYKDQGIVERGFRFLKDNTFLASSMFLEKPQRIEALLFIMTLCLTVYSAIEYKVRREMKEKGVTYKNQVKKEVQNPTAKWIFYNFTGVHVLYMEGKRQMLNLNKERLKIIRLLGNNYKTYYT